MPFSGPSSYLTTIDEFIQHWTDVNAALGDPPLELLPGPYTLATLIADRASLSTAITNLIDAINTVEGHRTDRDNRKEALRERMRQFGAFIRGVASESSYTGRIPDLIPFNANPGRWLIAMRDISDVWTDFNATPPAGFTPPLVLNGPYPIATYTADRTALETTFQNLTQTEQIVDQELQEREDIYLRVRDRLVTYRTAVEGVFPADHPLVLSIPRLVPLPGHTPDPVVLSGVWNAATSMADLSWTASPDPDLEEYEVRREGSTPYNVNFEQVVASLAPGTLVLATNAGLPSSGSTMGFKVYVILNTGNERGSNAVTVSRP